jgi:hypothetical protein
MYINENTIKKFGYLARVSSIRIMGGYCGGVPPLPIPNREVKPPSADGTTKVGE